MPRQGNGRREQVTGESLADSTQRAKRKGRRGGAEVVHQIPAEALPKVCCPSIVMNKLLLRGLRACPALGCLGLSTAASGDAICTSIASHRPLKGTSDTRLGDSARSVLLREPAASGTS